MFVSVRSRSVRNNCDRYIIIARLAFESLAFKEIIYIMSVECEKILSRDCRGSVLTSKPRVQPSCWYIPRKDDTRCPSSLFLGTDDTAWRTVLTKRRVRPKSLGGLGLELTDARELTHNDRRWQITISRNTHEFSGGNAAGYARNDNCKTICVALPTAGRVGRILYTERVYASRKVRTAIVRKWKKNFFTTSIFVITLSLLSIRREKLLLSFVETFVTTYCNIIVDD